MGYEFKCSEANDNDLYAFDQEVFVSKQITRDNYFSRLKKVVEDRYDIMKTLSASMETLRNNLLDTIHEIITLNSVRNLISTQGYDSSRVTGIRILTV